MVYRAELYYVVEPAFVIFCIACVTPGHRITSLAQLVNVFCFLLQRAKLVTLHNTQKNLTLSRMLMLKNVDGPFSFFFFKQVPASCPATLCWAKLFYMFLTCVVSVCERDSVCSFSFLGNLEKNNFFFFFSLTAAHPRLFLCVLCRAVSARPY